MVIGGKRGAPITDSFVKSVECLTVCRTVDFHPCEALAMRPSEATTFLSVGEECKCAVLICIRAVNLII